MPLTFTATAQPGNTPPRVRLDVDASTVSGATATIITRLDPDGSARLVRLADPGALSGGVALVYDYETPYSAAVTYTAAVLDSGGNTLTSGTAVVTLNVAVPWLIHPGIPALSVPLDGNSVIDLGTRTRKVNQGVFEPHGRAFPIVTTDGRRKSPIGQFTFRTRTTTAAGAFVALMNNAATVLVNIPASLGWGVTAEYWAVGDLDENRAVQIGSDAERVWSGPYLVVDRPAGGSQAQRTYADVLSEETSYQTLLTHRATYSEVLAPTS